MTMQTTKKSVAVYERQYFRNYVVESSLHGPMDIVGA